MFVNRIVSPNRKGVRKMDKSANVTVDGVCKLLYEKTVNEAIKAWMLMGVAVMVCGIVDFFISPEGGEYGAWVILLILMVYGVLLLIRLLVLKYRIDRGYYGNNVSEAREFIEFVQKNGVKKLIPIPPSNFVSSLRGCFSAAPKFLVVIHF